ncbi:MAG: hypothetical protein EXR98_08690 [Gemmataceae bacterium]|nr:hypothetical protein [Gemmataceae bacterium]
MSAMYDRAGLETMAAPARPWYARLRFPLFVVVYAVAILAVPRVGVALGLDAEPVLPLLMMTQLALPLGVLLLAVWFLFFSGLWFSVKLVVVLFIGLAVAGANFFLIRKVEFTTREYGLVPIFHFVWDVAVRDRLAAQLENDKANPDALPKIDATVGPEDFACYRGRNYDGILQHITFETDWRTHAPKLLWSRPCDGGYSGIAVARNIAVTLEQRGKQEAVVCFDRATGRQSWVYAYGAFAKDVMGDGPRSTPAIHNGRIFTTGATGQLVCLDVEGKKLWDINILEDSQAKNIQWKMTGSPLIVGDLVIAHAGIDPDKPAGAALVAFEQATGKKRWAVGSRPAGYSSPQLAVFGDQAQILLFDGKGLVSYDPATQKELWSYPWETKYDMNNIQPVIVGGDKVFISSETDNGCALLHIKPPDADSAKWRVEPVWSNRNLGARFANPVTDGQRIFGLNGVGGVLVCLDAANGKALWKGERYGPGQMLLAGKTLLVVSDKGVASLLDAEAGKETELARLQVLDSKTKTWNTPAVAGDQLFVRNQDEIACWKLPRR